MIKQIILILFLLATDILIVACDQTPKTPVSEYGDALIDSYKRGQQAGETANLDAIKKAISMYRAENGRYPQDLEEIKDLLVSEVDLSKYDYNPENGTISLK